MKIAVFHQSLDAIGGAEMVTLTLARELKADVFTCNVDRNKIASMGFPDVKIISIGKVPINAPFRQQLALYRFSKLKLGRRYNFYIISGDWAVSAAVHNHPNLWYVHSPIRELYDLYEYTRDHLVANWKRPLFVMWAKFNKYLNQTYVGHVDTVVCNGRNTQKRIQRYLHKRATIVNPPIETASFRFGKQGGYWLSVNRLIGHKRIDLQLKAFRNLSDERLVVVGSYEKSDHFLKYARKVRSMKPDNVSIKSWVSKDDLVGLYSGCKGFITTAKDEDFGMAPVEAMASGKPVIASNEGGHKETVVHNETGVLIDDIDEEKLMKSISFVSNILESNPNAFKKRCMARARKFDTKIFIQKIKEHIKNAT